MLPDDQLDALLRDANPRAPAGFEDRVMSRVRRPPILMFAAAAILLLAVAGVGTLFLLHRTPTIVSSGWFHAGRPVAEGATVSGELTSGDRRASVSEAVEVHRPVLRLQTGEAMLYGENIVVETTPARITTISPDAEVEVAMNAKRVGATVVAAGAAVLSVHILRGAAKIEPAVGATSQQPVLLAQGDRALVSARRPPAILRSPHPGSTGLQYAAHPVAHEHPTAIQAPPSPPLPPIGEAKLEGSLDKDTIRAGIVSIIPRVKECYEKAAEKDPKLGGKMVAKFTIRAKDGHGRIDEAEIDPEEDSVQSPLMEQCVLNAIADIDFPAPQGGGEVHVSYPFLFAQAGDDR